MRNPSKPIAAESRGVVHAPAFGGSLLALLFWWQSLTPTMITRSWTTQTVVGAVCLAIGYGIGTLAGCAVHRLLERYGRLPGSAIRRRSRFVLAILWLLALVVGSKLWLGWQNEQRSFMGMTSIGWLDGLLMGVLSPLAGALLVIFARIIARGAAALNRRIRRHVPSIVSVPATALLLIVIGIALARGVALPAITANANVVHSRANEDTTEGTVAPESPAVSGSSGSLVAWNTLGRMGRDFAATVTTRQELAMFHGSDAKLVDPVRVYVGARSANSLEQRAQLAVRELERAGGFERKLLVVWIPTGTGWIVPNAAATLEQLYAGDTAIVAIQYSFLPSRLAIFMDAGLADEAGITLFDAVRARWSKLPPQHRPKLVLFGKSLGAAGVEAPFVGEDASSSVANMVARTEGVLIAGAMESNPIHAQLTRERDRGSPFWQPVFDGGSSVRFLTRDPHQPRLDPNWTAPRIVYLQHPADPAVFWNTTAFWRPPEWLARPRGFDMPEAMHWFPIVSGVQAVADLINQLFVPPGFGHNYSSEDYIRGWASVMPPEGWTDADTSRLARFLDKVPGDDSEP